MGSSIHPESQGHGDRYMIAESLGETANAADEESTSGSTQTHGIDDFNVQHGRRRHCRILSSLLACALVYLVLCLKVLQCLPLEYYPFQTKFANSVCSCVRIQLHSVRVSLSIGLENIRPV